MRLLVLYLMMASGLFAGEWFTLTLKDGLVQPLEDVESLEKGLKGRGLHLVAPGDTKMEMYRLAQSESHKLGNGKLKFSVSEGDVESVSIEGIGEEYVKMSGKPWPPIVGVDLIGDMLAVGVYDKKRRVYMHVDGTGEKAFQLHLKDCIDFEPRNKQGESLVALGVSPESTMKESLKALEIVKKQSGDRLLFDTGFNSPDHVFPYAWRYPGMIGQSSLDPATRVDLRLEYDSKNQRVTVFNAAGKELKIGEQLRAYYKDEIEHAEKVKKPVWLCLEGAPEMLSYFGKPFALMAADVGIDFVVCRTPGTKLKLESLYADEYVFSIDDLRLAEGDRFRSRPIIRTLPRLAGGAQVSDPMICHVSKEKMWVDYGVGESHIGLFKQRLAVYREGASTLGESPIVLICFDPNVSNLRVKKILEKMSREDVTPLVIYQDLKGKAPNKEASPKKFAKNWGNIEEHERLENIFK